MSTALLDSEREVAPGAMPTMLTPFSFGLAGSVIDGRGSGVIAASIRSGDIDEDDPGSCSDDDFEFTRRHALSLN
jgi:hypothetical protein